MPRSSLTVVTPALSQDLTVLATVKAEFGIKASDRSKDDLLKGYITAASGMCAEWCRRSFGRAVVRESFTFDACEREVDRLVLSQRPVTAVSDVDSVLEGDDVTSLVADTDFYLEGDSLLVRGKTSGSTWWTGGRVVVEYTGGYLLLDSVPFSLERACIRLVASMYHGRTRDPNVRSVSIPDVEAVTYGSDAIAEGVPLEVRALLKPYKRVL